MARFPDNSWEKPKVNKRIGPDLVKAAIFWLGIVSWIVFSTSLILIFKAMPQESDLLTKIKGGVARNYWDGALIDFNYNVVWILFCVSLFAIAINKLRMKRKGDKYNKFNLLMFIYSSLSILIIFLTK
ncbi:MAG: hypothetical protein JXR48_13725 [Candidatus Delongbacteria bacterium]|nr:hypothetical protein [Candidatus Delongbacteria bacterium]MBN2836016.1 hypothetical protein [Candidatus Delongbacteria bacterium]